jgi:hypothetical protein
LAAERRGGTGEATRLARGRARALHGARDLPRAACFDDEIKIPTRLLGESILRAVIGGIVGVRAGALATAVVAGRLRCIANGMTGRCGVIATYASNDRCHSVSSGPQLLMNTSSDRGRAVVSL